MPRFRKGPDDAGFVKATGDQKDDPVNPSHYRAGGIECIDAIEAASTREEFVGFLKGQIIKYLWRAKLKGHEDLDYRKAKWYQDRLDSTMKKERA